MRFLWVRKKSGKLDQQVKKYLLQECIPVGCVPTAAVAATRCQYQGGLPPGRGEQTPSEGTPSSREQTDASKNISFPYDR